MTHRLSTLDSPLGPLLAVTGRDGALHGLDYADHADRLHRLFARHHPGAGLSEAAPPPPLVAALAGYFAGDLAALAPVGVAAIGSPFQRRAWAALRAIPPGETRSYGAQAAAMGCPSAARAVGLANGANPIAIVVPCHRVVGAGGGLTGYAGGVERKAWLLGHEGALAARRR